MSLLLLFNQTGNAAAATAKLKRNSSLNGLGASGPFFHDMLATIVLMIGVFGAFV